ncbi:MAG: heme lyase CcmF/NrfE family subunit [Gammaproteobacteria bacterium]|nr:MAG: heme lyase CcmF/NrfE family subunit [Gammaproteobacteria bacterium]
MIPELGHFCLILALCLALIQSIYPLLGAARDNPAWIALARPAARGQLGFLALAFVALTYSFIVNDFTVAYVAENSNSQLPAIYRISAVWGAHEGSLLLWVLILGIWTFAVTIFSRNLAEVFTARVIGVMGLVSTGFLLFLLFTSNPFRRYFPAPPDGADLNPLLQDPGLVVHPPMLYTGYVGFAVVFGFAIAALLGGRLDAAWARWSRPWTTVAWLFLTLGIALGSWWAYYELGWGGWWFWDPVENASFMPWLAGTALIHTLAATEKRGVFKHWTVLLAICAFSLSLLGTFLVRSGVLTSVHAFAADPTRGLFILILLGIVIGGSLLLYALRAPGIAGGGAFEFISRETLLLGSSVLLTVAMASVLLGTVYPLIVEAFGFSKLSVGAPYFNSVFVPLMIPVAILLGLGVLTAWRADDWGRLWPRIWPIALGSGVLGVALIVMLAEAVKLQTILALILALWIAGAALSSLWQRLRRDGWETPAGYLGMTLAHLGFAISIVGICITSHYSRELHERMGAGDVVELAGYQYRLDAIDEIEGPNYHGYRATAGVTRGGRSVADLHSEKRVYTVRNMPMTEAGIDAGLFRDLYISLGEPLDEGTGAGDWSIRLYYRPLVRWIWLGAIFMAAGGLLAACDRRYRVQVKHAATEASRAAAPGRA